MLRQSRRRFALSLAAFALCGLSARAFGQSDGRSIAHEVEHLKAGEFLWEPEVAPVGPVLVVVSLTAQRAYVYRNGLLIGVSTSSTGKPGHETPKGVFTILQKQVDHKSNLYNDASMPFMQRLTWSGVAMHAGNLPGYPASHGCIRLPLAFARHLYGISKLGMTVVIMEGADVPRIAPSPDMLAGPSSPSDAGPDSKGDFWQPERSVSGPLSIVISGADRRMVVLRNGIVIGSVAVRLKTPVLEPAAFSLLSIAPDGPHWARLPLLSERLGDSKTVTVEKDNILMPDAVRTALRTILSAGTTVVVTPDTLEAGGAGQQLTVLTGER